jgi:hypothetical protein
MKIKWSRCLTYASAAKAKGVIYLHEWHGAPFYWGLADNYGQRYNVGYSHWIEGVLQHGGRLYIGKPDKLGNFKLEDVEYVLIEKFGSIQNKKRKSTKPIDISHEGNVPESIEKPGKNNNNG